RRIGGDVVLVTELAGRLERQQGYVNTVRNDDPFAKAEGLFGQLTLLFSSVVDRGCFAEHATEEKMPRHQLARTLLLHAPRLQRAEGAHDVRYPMPLARPRRGIGRV